MSTDSRPLETIPGLPARYTLERKLGSGGMGEVWLARDSERQTTVALKRLRMLSSEAGEADRLRFRREFLLLRDLSLEGTVRVHDFGECADGLFYTMEHVEGWTLPEYLRGGHWPGAPGADPAFQTRSSGLAALWALADELLVALGELHARGLVHRDLKPGNVMVTPQGRVKLIDFGLARLGAQDQGLTAAGELLGTPSYLAPEQIRSLPLDGRSDLYSFGVLMFELATGRLPFQAPSVAETLLAHLQQAPPDPAALNPALGAPLSAFLLRLLAKEPSGRPPGAEAARAALHLAMSALSGVAQMPTLRMEAIDDGHQPPGLLRAPFTGNPAALRELTGGIDALLRGEGLALVVTAPSGGGKSRMVEEMRARAPERGFRLACGAAREDGNLNGQVFQGVLADLAPLIAADRALAGADGAVLAHHFPALRRIPGLADDRYQPLAESGERGRLLIAFGALIGRLAARVPLAIAAEDLHWADPLSLEMAALLATNFTGPAPAGGAPVLLFANYRSDDPGDAARWAGRIAGPATRQFTLAPVDAGAAGGLVRALLGCEEHPPASFVGRLLELTGGNPLHLQETLRAMLASGELHRTRSALEGSGGWNFEQWLRTEASRAVSLPLSLHAAAARRLAGFTGIERQALQAAALIGREFTFARWLALAGAPEDDLLSIAERGLRAGLLDEPGVERLRFVHDQLRAALLEELSGLRRRRLHARMAELLAADGEGALVERVRHAAAGGMTAIAAAEGPDAVQRLLDFARLEEARVLIDAIEAMLAGNPALRRRLFRLRQKKILLLGRTGRLEEGLAEAEALLALARELGDAEALMTGHYWTAFIRSQIGDLEGTIEHARAAVATAPDDVGPAFRCLQHQILGAVLLQQGRHAEAEVELRAAVETARAAGDPRQLAWAINAMGTFHFECGALAAAADAFAAARATAAAADYQMEAAAMGNNLGETLIERGQLREADARLSEGMRIQLAAGAMYHATDPALNRGRALRLMGENAQAARVVAEAAGWAERSKLAPLIGRALMERAWLALDDGDAAGARAFAAQASERFERANWDAGLQQCRAFSADLLIRAGDPAGARAAALAAAGDSRPHLRRLARAALHVLDADARGLDEIVAECAGPDCWVESALRALHLAARARLAAGDAPGARAALAQARALPGFEEFAPLARENLQLRRQADATA